MSNLSNNTSALHALLDLVINLPSAGSGEEIPEVELATPSISVDATGKITATVTQEAGKVAAGTKTATMSQTTQAGKTVTPTEAEQTAVAAYRYTTGAVKVAGFKSAADEVRELSGASGTMTLAGMTSYLSAANDEVDTQTDLISQIVEVANNLPEAGSGGGLDWKCVADVPDVNGDTYLVSIEDEFSGVLFYDGGFAVAQWVVLGLSSGFVGVDRGFYRVSEASLDPKQIEIVFTDTSLANQVYFAVVPSTPI